MQIGAKNVLGTFSADCWEVIYDSEITADTTSVTISSLNGDVDDYYLLSARFVNPLAGASDISVKINNDGGANYGYQYLRARATTIDAASGSTTKAYIGAGVNQTDISYAKLVLYAKTDFERPFMNDRAADISGSTAANFTIFGNSYKNSSTNLTNLVIASDQANGVGSGTNFILYRKVDK